jgi:hypothetical protein
MAVINTHISLVNKEIETVKAHIQELIGIDVSNLTIFGDLSNLEDNLKQNTDEAIDSIPQPDLTDYATKDEIPDLTNYATKLDLYYDGDPKKDLRIKYHADRTENEANHKNNIYIGGSFYGSGTGSDWQNVIIGHCSITYSYRNVILGNNSNCDCCESICIGTESFAHGYSTTIGFDAQTNGLYGVVIGRQAQAKKRWSCNRC